MLGAAVVPGALLFAASIIAPKSPCWLMMKSRRKEAQAELLKVQPGSDTGPPLDAIEAVLRDEGAKASWGKVFQRRWRQPLLIALGFQGSLAVLGEGRKLGDTVVAKPTVAV